MIIHTGSLPNPAPKLIVDLISRSGSPNEESLSPYDGMQDLLKEQSFRIPWSLVVEMLQNEKDYDARAQQPIAGKYVKRAEKGGDYLTRLEDIDASWVRSYVRDALIGLKLRDKGGVREYSHNHTYARTYIDEEGGIVDESELSIEVSEFSAMEVAQAKAKLPYLLKRLHDKSIELRVSVLSLLQAYEYVRGYTKSSSGPKPKQILDRGVLRMTAEGHISSYFPDSANSAGPFRTAFAWIRGNDKDAYFYDAIEFLHVCRVLGIDFSSIDPTDFQAEQIANLRVTYLRSNREYLDGPRGYNMNLLSAVGQLGVADYQSSFDTASTLGDYIRYTVQQVSEIESDPLYSALKQEPDPISWSRFFRAYASYCPGMKVPIHIRDKMTRRHSKRTNSNFTVNPLLSDFYANDGFLCQLGSRGAFQQFPMKHIAPSYIAYETAIAHASGYIFLVTRTDDLYYIDIDTVTDYINTYHPKVRDLRGPAEECQGWQPC